MFQTQHLRCKNSDPAAYFKVNSLQNQNPFAIKQRDARERGRALGREGTVIKMAVGNLHTHTLTHATWVFLKPCLDLSFLSTFSLSLWLF